MTIKEAMECRHTVRKYTDRAIPPEVSEQLNARICENNDKFGINMTLVTENEAAFGSFLKLVLAKGVRNYIVLAGPDTSDTDEKLGYCGADVMLFAQTLGLSSWWVGGTYSKKAAEKSAGVSGSEKVIGVIAVGYGATQGTAHKSKPAEKVSSYSGAAPEWFKNGVRAALLAPTALNRQGFFVKGDGSRVSMTYSSGVMSGTDLGICKYHFEVGAGKENFQWA